MTKFYYVYMLTDAATGTHFHTGVTEDLHARLDKHNSGEVPHTSKFKPWRIETAVAFSSKEPDFFSPWQAVRAQRRRSQANPTGKTATA